MGLELLLGMMEGNYKNDKKCGQGKFVWGDGCIYEGDRKEGKQHGVGVFMNGRGKVKRRMGRWIKKTLA